MTQQLDDDRGVAFYQKFYQTGGWRYSFWREYLWHRRHMVKRFGLHRGMRVLEVACGSGFHTHLLNRMGFDCVGVDRSEAGIAWARRHYPLHVYHCCDLRKMPLDEGSFDAVLARGCSHYHYDLMDEIALDTTGLLMRYLKPGGVFIMAIATDLSGRREADKIWHNTLDDYRQHFASFGLRWSVDWVEGMAICGLYQSPVGEVVPAESVTAGAVASAVL
ncbi:MAG: class I SAM-dependent methyltransferase [Phycisphaerae bacterium]